ncbi:hypothetical protein [Bradyrhizobium sp. LA2.1]|uniref:hypothetical protein n=1 Tax=Bradyrhizobium sp. LA2.1 TaxID=3156376 RepID=UPI00339B0824
MAYRKDWGQPQAGLQGEARTRKVFGRTVTVGTADNVTGNTIGAFMVPAWFTVTGILGSATDMDSGTAMLITIGDAGSANRFVTSLNTQAAVTSLSLAAAGLLYTFATDTEVLITIATQAGTPVAGTVTAYLDGFVN